MRKSWEKKSQIVDSYSGRIQKSSLVIFFDFTGVDAQAMTKLRADMKGAEGEVLVGKNTLFYRAFMNTVVADHREVLTGPTAFAFAYKDPVKVAKVLFDFVKEIDKDKPLSKIKGAYMQGRFLKPAEVQALAELPPKEVLVSKLMGAIQGPIYALVMALKSAPQKLVLTLKAIEEKKS
ncbi:MAG: 50S ribosomal protein L10 [Aquificaceae bacterium]|nr:50S ribosomal protein L10 [Aquificaceae bacterium]MCX8060726.1 50S ribosomal protein L10 [Aquificaceae bacterium]MDW8097161.1 50S ribosomal protein L10 [Aquificaceae bacterium]